MTRRELEILRLVAQGLSDKEAAAVLGLSEHTIHRHISNVLNKLDVPSRAAAVAQAAQRGLLSTPPLSLNRMAETGHALSWPRWPRHGKPLPRVQEHHRGARYITVVDGVSGDPACV